MIKKHIRRSAINFGCVPTSILDVFCSLFGFRQSLIFSRNVCTFYVRWTNVTSASMLCILHILFVTMLVYKFWVLLELFRNMFVTTMCKSNIYTFYGKKITVSEVQRKFFFISVRLTRDNNFALIRSFGNDIYKVEKS